MVNSENLIQSKENIQKVLTGEITKDNHPYFFDDDLFYFAVQTVEKNDLEWLMTQINEPKYPKDYRGLVVLNMSDSKKFELLKNFI